jgi:hypothetical protein
MRRKADRPNGRGLTYRERWESLRDFVSEPSVLCTDGHSSIGEVGFHLFTPGALREEMNRLDRVRVVKARPSSRADRAKLKRIARRQQRQRKGA